MKGNSLRRSSNYRSPHVHPLLNLTAGVHTWCRTGDVQEAGEWDQHICLLTIFIFLSFYLSSPFCIGCQSIFEPGGDGSPVLCWRILLEKYYFSTISRDHRCNGSWKGRMEKWKVETISYSNLWYFTGQNWSRHRSSFLWPGRPEYFNRYHSVWLSVHRSAFPKGER